MANKLYEETNIQAIANAIRGKGQSGTMTVAQMPSKINAISTKETITWNQCPDAVKNYLAYLNEHPYDPSNYSNSVIDTYREDVATSNDSKPIGQTIDGVTYYNEEPNKQTPFASQNVAGTLEPLDQIRWIRAYPNWSQDVRNCRDVGGWACDGGTIKYGKMFRSGDITTYNADVLVGQLGVGAELDLDQAHLEQTSKLGNILYHGATANIQYSLSNKEAWKDILGFVFYCVLNNITILFHCAIGCDRTGTLACIIESILGLNRSDLDADYEMSSFSGTGYVKKRNNELWKGFVSQITSLQVGTTFRDKVINWVASLGFTATEINAFRAAMIDGYDPQEDDVTLDVDTFTVANNLSHATSDNSATSVTGFQPYEANILPASGYAISSVQILMNGVDVTAQVWDGENTNLYRAIQKTLAHCTIDNTKTIVVDNESFAGEVTADDGYTLDGATVSITMGGVDITNQVWMTKEDN